MIQLIPIIVKLIGVRRLGRGALWLLRAVGMLVLIAAVLLAVKLGGEQVAKRMLIYGGVGLVIAGIQALWKRRKGKALPEIVGERTIDGKVVPNMLAAAALGIPPQSADGGDVLRGLPDYGKVLLKLDAGDFRYVPGQPGDNPVMLSLVEKPAPNASWFMGRAAQFGIVVAVIALMIAAEVGLGLYQASRDSQRNTATVQDVPEPVAAPRIDSQPAMQSQPVPEQNKLVDTRATTQAAATLRVPAIIREAAPPVSTPAANLVPSKAPARDAAPPAASTEVAEAKEQTPVYSAPVEPSATRLPSQPKQVSIPASVNLCLEFQGIHSCNLLRREGNTLVGKWPNGDTSHMEIERFNATDITLNDSDKIASNQQTVHIVYKAAVQGNQFTHGTIFYANNPIGTWSAEWEP